MGYPYGQQQGPGYPPVGQQGYAPYGGQGAPGYGTPAAYGTPVPSAPGYGAPGHSAPGYGTPGHGAPAYGTPGYGASGYGAPQGPVSGTTGILAAVLALLLSLISLAGAAVSYNATSALECTGKYVQTATGSFECADSSIGPMVMTFVVIGAAIGLLLFIGSILLFLRKTAGRVIVIIVAALSALGSLGSLAATAASSLTSGAGVAIGLVQAAVALVMLGLAAAPSTGRWIRAAQQRPTYPQGNYQRY
ncbi:hypothetical protein [Nocardia sp. NPDC058705]|uniref:hypothetical protein n=1 Tax=Nocardia sp. NPDC058705 TaxID=3346609 RepID=UPI0036B34D40